MSGSGGSPTRFPGALWTQDEAAPGDVLVVACDGFTGTTVAGDLGAGMMKNKGCVGFVTDGLARDRAGIIATGLPVFTAGISPNSGARNGPGMVGLPVNLGGWQVKPGDIIVGDADAAVVVPLERAEAVLRALEDVRASEAKAEQRVRQGATMSLILAAAWIIQG